MDIASYQLGFTDCADKVPSRYPVTPPVIVVGPTPAPRLLILPMADLSSTINKLPAGSLVSLKAGAKYVAQSVITPQAGVSIDMAGADVDYLAVKGFTSLFSITGKQTGVEVFNVHFIPKPYNSVHVLFHVAAAGFSGHDCYIADGLAQVGMTAAGGVGAKFDKLTVGKTLSCSMYTEEDDTTWSNSTFAGSLNETTLRTSPPSPTRIAARLMVLNSTVFGGGAGKGSMEWRQHTAGSMIGCDLRDYVLFGEGEAPAVGLNYSGLVQKCTFRLTNPAMGQLDVNAACQITVNECILETSPTQVAISMGKRGSGIFTGNKRLLIPPGCTHRPNLWATKFTGADAPVVAESGSVVI